MAEHELTPEILDHLERLIAEARAYPMVGPFRMEGVEEPQIGLSADVAEQYLRAARERDELRARAEKAEARAKELEDHLKSIVVMYGSHADCSKLAARAVGWTRAEADAAVKEARDRESERVRAALAQKEPR